MILPAFSFIPRSSLKEQGTTMNCGTVAVLAISACLLFNIGSVSAGETIGELNGRSVQGPRGEQLYHVRKPECDKSCLEYLIPKDDRSNVNAVHRCCDHTFPNKCSLASVISCHESKTNGKPTEAVCNCVQSEIKTT